MSVDIANHHILNSSDSFTQNLDDVIKTIESQSKVKSLVFIASHQLWMVPLLDVTNIINFNCTFTVHIPKTIFMV